ncbi:hypothetical protein [Oscillatoria acuminata]|nr:hypothetical protein [Oscillatoria acuminata]
MNPWGILPRFSQKIWAVHRNWITSVTGDRHAHPTASGRFA